MAVEHGRASNGLGIQDTTAQEGTQKERGWEVVMEYNDLP